ncbi:hypothetical protein [Ciceribacter sp. L1K22]|uniref:hypothetical protein n=1 Tax=Ciceribacter sp. L1K22 TaxID=2820275 RepID=UPI001ABDB382|nr:hypothetical protein [Ciceribacter sp. L1K22]MBO3758926.1 hypothetical protein [Ciceribacter sp. L1K22]
MKLYLVIVMLAVLTGCSQTGGQASADASKKMSANSVEQSRDKSAASACEDAIRHQTNSAMMGSALGMVGGFGGFGGRGGAVAANVASSAGGMVAQQQAARHQQDVERNCY